LATNPQVLIDQIKSDPQFQELVRKRSTFAWILTILMLIIYFGFVLTVAFNKQLLAKSLMGGVTTVGMPLGVFVIVSAFILTGIYVYRANGEFDDITKKIVEKVKK
jgi:uncharacterized membrane protein (DUF485 family)